MIINVINRFSVRNADMSLMAILNVVTGHDEHV